MILYNTSLLLTVSRVHLLTPDSQHAIVSPSAAYRAVRNSTQSVDSSPPMKRQRSLKVELVVSSPCHQIRGPRAAGDGARFTLRRSADRPPRLAPGDPCLSARARPGPKLPWGNPPHYLRKRCGPFSLPGLAWRAFARWFSGIQLASASVSPPIREG